MIEFKLEIEPQSKLRPRFGNNRTYTPAKTVSFERHVLILANKYRPLKPIPGALKVELDFYLKVPKRLTREYPTTKPDVDNLSKAILDAFNGVFWVDDSQVVNITVKKRYALKFKPCIYVRIHEAWHEE